jgi:hypothetical protein
MGSGGFGTNASLHWKISHADDIPDAPIAGRDPIDPDNIGMGSTRTGDPWTKGHKGFIRVRMRFTGPNAANSLKKLRDLVLTLTPSGDDTIEVDVPIVPRTKDEIERDLKGDWEVRVDW